MDRFQRVSSLKMLKQNQRLGRSSFEHFLSQLTCNLPLLTECGFPPPLCLLVPTNAIFHRQSSHGRPPTQRRPLYPDPYQALNARQILQGDLSPGDPRTNLLGHSLAASLKIHSFLFIIKRCLAHPVCPLGI